MVTETDLRWDKNIVRVAELHQPQQVILEDLVTGWAEPSFDRLSRSSHTCSKVAGIARRAHLEDQLAEDHRTSQSTISRAITGITPHVAHRDLLDREKEFNTQINKIRYVIERTIANFKTWRITHTDYRRPLKNLRRDHIHRDRTTLLPDGHLNKPHGQRVRCSTALW